MRKYWGMVVLDYWQVVVMNVELKIRDGIDQTSAGSGGHR